MVFAMAPLTTVVDCWMLDVKARKGRQKAEREFVRPRRKKVVKYTNKNK
jgi:hypothetical protein